MARDPLVSFIVLSYNYERYVGATLRSILDQTFGDFEVVVVDDASTDRSCDVVRSFDDPRIRLHENERNLGGAGSYNRAIGLARGELLVNLDADDWIAPRKTELQLAAFERDPALDVLGTWVEFVDAAGARHPRAAEFEPFTNVAQDLNLLDAWVVRNGLCRSSTMMRRRVHERIGPDDAAMVRAPDFELWTRALRHGCRFGVLPEKLTYLRVQDRGVTYGDPRGQYLEICHLLARNLVPVVEERALWPSLTRILYWVTGQEQFAWLAPEERWRLLGLFLAPSSPQDYPGFLRALEQDDGGALAAAGRRCYALTNASPVRNDYIAKLHADIEAFVDARDYFRKRAEYYEGEAAHWRQRVEGDPVRRVLRRVKQLLPLGRP